MRRILVIISVFFLLTLPVRAQEFTAPTLPQSAQKYMPEQSGDFIRDLWYIIKIAIGELQPTIANAAGICLAVIVITVFVGIVHSVSSGTQRIAGLSGTIAMGVLLLSPTGTLVDLSVETITQIHEYGKLLIPVITSAMAAQGGVTSSAALCTVTTIFCSVLTTMICKLLVPLLYVYLSISLVSNALQHEMLAKLKDFIKWLITWSLKTILYLFTGFLTVTGIVSGTTDASALKAAKLTISGFVPVVGGILSDASEAVLVGAGLMKNAAGIYGLFAILAIAAGPFFKIGIQYLLIKLTAGVCSIFGSKDTTGMIQDFSATMGITLAMTGTECVILLISIICFMKGAGL